MKKKFENIVIATDLDGTYFGNSVRLVPRNLSAVEYFCENGGHFTFATGRLPLFMRRSIPNANELINMPAVTGNGTCLYDFSKAQALREHFLADGFLNELSEFLNEELRTAAVGLRAVTREGIVVNSLENPHIKKEFEYLPDFMEKRLLTAEGWKRECFYKVNVMGDDAELCRLYPILEKHFAGRAAVTRSGYLSIEIMPGGTSKAVMLRELIDERFGNDAYLCTLGDYDNDLEMHSIANLSVCPSNANDKVKAACDLCLCSNEEGLIGALIENLSEYIK